MHRKTRFVCVSDTHGYTPSEAGFKLPAGDVLIHAGDLTNKGSMSELRRTMDWISNADFEIKIIVAGNHDVSLDSEIYAQHGRAFHGPRLEDPQQCIETITRHAPSVVLLRHQAAVIRLTRANGPRTAFKVFGSPHLGLWIRNVRRRGALEPDPPDADLIVTHTPPRSHCDKKPDGTSVGCDALRQTLSRIRPPLAICGHVHEGRGYERVGWRGSVIETGCCAPADVDADRVMKGTLPPRESKKINLIDLTGKRGDRLDNRGFACGNADAVLQTRAVSKTEAAPLPLPEVESAAGTVPDQGYRENGLATPTPSADIHIGGHLLSLRKETCIINAAVMATSWPHRGGKLFNAPIVVDIELPVHHEV
ncbi:hypothetical protein N7532_010223 [Penicillium argentinense]|uniref:Calcineurin-like phosphoesterase domain-containing protein n=1 Tax=Penicillium argentinense TaxID=1131581 RepID=A0A9W9EP72_9EURO|nr:uncharacterized protein N7532_010223 [Penicillium argentinense]KAJ5085452.1 hypothetical protein N7532_010223 [Penicillium argentinense]